MKKFRSLKIVLILAIFLILCAISIQVKATLNISGDKYTFYFGDVLHGDDLFCTQKDVTLSTTAELRFKKDGPAYTYAGDSEKIAERAWAYLFAVNMPKYEEDTTYNILADSPLQKAIWDAMLLADIGYNGDFAAFLKDTVSSDTYNETKINYWKTGKEIGGNMVSNKLLKEAYAYAEKAPRISRDAVENLTIDTSRVVNSGTIVGPFYVKNCSYFTYTYGSGEDAVEEVKAGITSVSVTGKNNAQLGQTYKLIYYDNKTPVEITDMVTFNKKMASGFYIEFTNEPTVSEIHVSVTYQYINPIVTIQPIITDMGNSEQYSFVNLCSAHAGLSLTVKGSAAYYTTPYSTDYGWRVGSNLTDSIGNNWVEYTRVAGVDGKTQYQFRCTNGHEEWADSVNALQNMACPICKNSNLPQSNRLRIPIAKDSFYTYTGNTRVVYYYLIKYHEKFTGKCNTTISYWSNKDGAPGTCTCGSVGTIYLSYQQRLIHVTSDLNPGTTQAEVTVDLIPKLQELTLLKANKETGNALTGAKFSGTITNIKSFTTTTDPNTNKVSAKSDNTYSFTDWEVGSNGKISIYNVELADKDTNVVVTLTETTVPTGYVGVSGTITATINYNDDTATVKVDGATSSLVSATYDNGVITVTVKNTKKIIDTLRLRKIDADTNKPLTNAKFEITVTNVESFKRGNTTYVDGESSDKDGAKNNSITNEFLVNSSEEYAGLITFSNVILANRSSYVYVTVHETKTPAGYETIGDFKLKISYTGETVELVSGDGSLISTSFDKDDDYKRTVEYTVKNTKNTIEEIKLLKVDKETGTVLTGAKFKLTVSNVKSFKRGSSSYVDGESTDKDETKNNSITNEFLVNDSGLITMSSVVLADRSKPVIVKIEELRAPSGYSPIPGPIEISIQYKATSPYITYSVVSGDSSFIEFGDVETGESGANYNRKITVKVKDQKKEIDLLRLYKVDSETEKALTDAKFELTITNVESFERNSTIYKDGDSNDKNAAANTITHTFTVSSVEEYKGMLSLYNVILADIDANVVVTLKEIEAPKGYETVKEVVLTISYKNETVTGTADGVAISATFTKDPTTFERTVAYTVKDFKKMIEKIRFIKVDKDTGEALKGAKFKVTASNIVSFERDDTTFVDGGNGDGDETKNNSITAEFTVGSSDTQKGYLTLYNVILANRDNPVTVKLEEVKAPNGYIPIFDPIEVSINYKNSAQGYITYEITQGDSDTVEFVEIKNAEAGSNYSRVIVFKVKNEKKPFANITLLKIDHDGGNVALPGVAFKGTISNVIDATTFANVTKFEGTTDSNGQINLSNYMIKDVTKPITIVINETAIPERDGYRFRQLNGAITISLIFDDGNLKLGEWSYSGTEEVTVTATNNNSKNPTININIPNERVIDISGMVWRDGDTIINNKTNGEPDGKISTGEVGVPNVIVYLKNSAGTVVQTKITDTEGKYIFTDVDYDLNGYYVEFEYDGVKNIETRQEKPANATGSDSKASETASERTAFNNKFFEISNNLATATDKTTKTALSYSTETNEGIQKSTLITTGTRTVSEVERQNVVLTQFAMKAISDNKKITATTTGLNLGLILRGTDLAASNKVLNAKVTINDKEAPYPYDAINNRIDVDKRSSAQDIAYNLIIRKSDFTYRIRDYANVQPFTENGFTDNNTADGTKSGDELKVYVTYRVDLVNQSEKGAGVEQIKYFYDSRYTFVEARPGTGLTVVGNISNTNNTLTINLNDTNESKQIDGFASKYIDLVFMLPIENIADDAEYYNAVEIEKYHTNEGLIDVDSNPGNLNYNQATRTGTYEDDSDEAGGVIINIIEDNPRIISGYVFEDANKEGTMGSDEAKLNDVIVQLIEIRDHYTDASGNVHTIKDADGNVLKMEYIWQETVSGSNKLRKLAPDGQSVVETTYTKHDGYYEFSDFIPGDYIVRFIYGDGTTYDLTGNVVTYNGQDYKSTIDPKYRETYYNPANYAANSSVARDNEARRLGTMAYATDIDADKGILLKLLDLEKLLGQKLDDFERLSANDKNSKINAAFNEVEKQTIIKVYNTLYGQGEAGRTITEVTYDAVRRLLKEQTLVNTWMCAETSLVNVGVETNVNLNKVYFGLANRPDTKIELHKLITGYKLTASNGQVLVNATVDVNRYFDNSDTFQEYIEGIKDSIQAINEYWKYEIEPTKISTVVEGASLEYEYTIVVVNSSDDDYLSNALITAYRNGNYSNYLTNQVKPIKTNIRKGTHTNGAYLGTFYYTGVVGDNRPAQVEVTSIKDYIRNNLKYIKSTNDATQADSASQYVLNDDFSISPITINTVLVNGHPSGKIENDERSVIFAATLQPATVMSATGSLDFANYIAEVMMYTNAAGRRSQTSTPGNTETVDQSHEIDESKCPAVEISAATGNDARTPYVWLTAIACGLVIFTAGAYTTKKFLVKE